MVGDLGEDADEYDGEKHRVTLVPIIKLNIVHPIEETFQFVLLTLESPLVQAERALKAPLPLQGGPSEGCIFR